MESVYNKRINAKFDELREDAIDLIKNMSSEFSRFRELNKCHFKELVEAKKELVEAKKEIDKLYSFIDIYCEYPSKPPKKVNIRSVK